MNPPAYTTAEVAALFRVLPPTVTRWAELGRLHPWRTPGGQYRFPRAEVDALLGGQSDAAAL